MINVDVMRVGQKLENRFFFAVHKQDLSVYKLVRENFTPEPSEVS